MKMVLNYNHLIMILGIFQIYAKISILRQNWAVISREIGNLFYCNAIDYQ